MNFSVSKLMLAGAVTGVLVCAMTTTALAADLTAGVGTVTASALKLRAEASTSSACLSLLPKGAVVLLEDEAADGWYKVTYDGETGYISSDYIAFSATSSADLGNGMVTGNSVNIRSAASTDASRVDMLDEGCVVKIVGVDNGWYKLSYNGKTGYIRSDYMELTDEPLTSFTASAKGSEIVSYAKQFLGVRYVYGGSSSSGFDCSGFTSYVMKHFGYNIPRTASTQMNVGTSVSKSALQAGDLVFFRDPSIAGSKPASHVGIYIGNNQFIHASSGGGQVQIDSLSSSYYSRYYAGARHII